MRKSLTFLSRPYRHGVRCSCLAGGFFVLLGNPDASAEARRTMLLSRSRQLVAITRKGQRCRHGNRRGGWPQGICSAEADRACRAGHVCGRKAVASQKAMDAAIRRDRSAMELLIRWLSLRPGRNRTANRRSIGLGQPRPKTSTDLLKGGSAVIRHEVRK